MCLFFKGSLSHDVEIVQTKLGPKTKSFSFYKAFYGENSQFEDNKMWHAQTGYTCDATYLHISYIFCSHLL